MVDFFFPLLGGGEWEKNGGKDVSLCVCCCCPSPVPRHGYPCVDLHLLLRPIPTP